MTTLHIPRKKVIFKVYIDLKDFFRLDYAINITANGYAVTRDEEGKLVLLHRWLMGVHNSGFHVNVDHKNRNKLDCRRSNLRVCNKSNNEANKKKRKHSKSLYKGVHTRAIKSGELRYDAYIRVEGRKKHLGSFLSPEEAARAYDKAATEAFGEFAFTNEAML